VTGGKKYAILIVGFLLVALSVTIFTNGGLRHIYYLYQQKERLERLNLELEEKNRKLSGEVAALKNNRAYLENLARQELGLVKEGDIVFQFEKDITAD
jgi:cell division protein FtsB